MIYSVAALYIGGTFIKRMLHAWAIHTSNEIIRAALKGRDLKYSDSFLEVFADITGTEKRFSLDFLCAFNTIAMRKTLSAGWHPFPGGDFEILTDAFVTDSQTVAKTMERIAISFTEDRVVKQKLSGE